MGKFWPIRALEGQNYFTVYLYKQQVPLSQFPYHPPQTHSINLKTEAVGSSETSQTTILIRHGKPKMPPIKHVLARHVCTQYMTVGCAVHKTLSVLHVLL